MANRSFKSQFAFSYAAQVVTLRAKLTFSSGVPSIVSGTGMGIQSITRLGTGDYSILLQDQYPALTDLRIVMDSGNAQPVAPIVNIVSDATSVKAAPILEIQLRDLSGVAAEPADTEVMHLEIELNNSSLGY